MSTKKLILKKVKEKNGTSEYLLTKNGLRVLFTPRLDTGVVTSNIVYMVGSRDESRGETGVAHMLEHMLFKPTTFDVARGTDSASMLFDREIGAVTNANTWKDRTTYYFSYPKAHFERALSIEAERMRGTILTDEALKPEQTNVLSEFDMYAGDEFFSLSAEMFDVAFRSHTYGHETIGYREDIEAYTAEKLTAFYDAYYVPNNAVLVIVGDLTERAMKRGVLTHFGHLDAGVAPRRFQMKEPKQEGVRTVTLKRESSKHILAFGVKHDAFPSQSWFETMVVFDMLAGGPDSVLYKKFVDAGMLSGIETSLEQSREQNLGLLFFTLTPKTTHEKMRELIIQEIATLTPSLIAPYLTKTIAKLLMSECISRENSRSFTAEIVEYVSAHAWEQFYESESTLKRITPLRVHAHMKSLFNETNTTIGYFIGTK